jgi:hypothetical protein
MTRRAFFLVVRTSGNPFIHASNHFTLRRRATLRDGKSVSSASGIVKKTPESPSSTPSRMRWLNRGEFDHLAMIEPHQLIARGADHVFIMRCHDPEFLPGRACRLDGFAPFS